MLLAPSYQEALFWRLGTFRPSDREEFARAFNSADGCDAAFGAVTQFVERWEQADWLEDYAIERIGKWLAKNAPVRLFTRYLEWAKARETAASTALLSGLQTRQAPEREQLS